MVSIYIELNNYCYLLIFSVRHLTATAKRYLFSKVVDSCDSEGRTSLQIAVAEEWFPGVSLLLEAGADVTLSCGDGDTVLHIAARSSKPQLLQELLNIPDSKKVFPFFSYIQYNI